MVYRRQIELTQLDYKLYLAIDDITYENLFQRKSIQAMIQAVIEACSKWMPIASERPTRTDQNAIATQRHILYTASHPVDETPKRFCLWEFPQQPVRSSRHLLYHLAAPKSCHR